MCGALATSVLSAAKIAQAGNRLLGPAKRVPMDRRVYFTPDILTNELTWFGLTSFVLVVMCIWFYHAPLEHHANPQVTPLHTTAPWYFLWLQGLLKLGDKVFFGLVIPPGLLGIFLVWPYLDVARSRRYVHRRFGLSLMLLFITAMLLLTYMGTPKFGVDTVPRRRIMPAASRAGARARVVRQPQSGKQVVMFRSAIRRGPLAVSPRPPHGFGASSP